MTRKKILLFAMFVSAGCGQAGASLPGQEVSPDQGSIPTPAAPSTPGGETASPDASTGGTVTRADLPQVLFSDADALLASRVEARSDAAPSPALRRLRAEADQALSVGPFTVTDKDQTAPTGDKHDYLSLGRYWWPNPDSPDGLPYVQVDGQVNPETETISDKAELQTLLPTVSTLAHAYFVFGDERYAEHAGLLLRTWFLDPETRMNPNLEYSQIHKGHTNMLGGSGIIDSREFATLPESVAMLKGSPAWTAEDDTQLRAWFTQYLDWYLNSPGGVDEEASSNNHRTYYWYQALPLMLYTGQEQKVDEILRGRLTETLVAHIKPDGSQPLELKRTKPFSYSVFNLWAWTRIATIAEARGIDLWNVQNENGRGSIRQAFTFLLPFVTGERELVDNPANPYRVPDFARLLGRASVKLDEPGWRETAHSLMGAESDVLDLDLVVAPPTR